MANQLTDREFWTTYWESKKNIAFPIPKKYLFHELLAEISNEEACKNAIELGGFPGYYTVFLQKHLHIQSTLLDYFVHPGIIHSLCQENGIKPTEIGIIETDLFAYTPSTKYDLVLSCGLIEHFKDTRDILARHAAFLKPGGTLFISLPNFRGINGWVQKTFDRENYNKHEMACMDPKLLKLYLEELGLNVQYARYFGKFSVWLEQKEQQSNWSKALVKIIWLVGKVWSKLFPIETKVLSPYIVLRAKKN